jgi:hypothetical protein
MGATAGGDAAWPGDDEDAGDDAECADGVLAGGAGLPQADSAAVAVTAATAAVAPITENLTLMVTSRT